MEYENLTLKNRRRINRNMAVSIVSVLVFIIILVVFLMSVGVRIDQKIEVDNCVTTIYHKNGTTSYFAEGKFDALNEGEKATVKVSIPDLISSKLPMPTLHFDAYNCAVKVYGGNRLIYTDGWKDARNGIPEQFIGNRCHTISLVTDAYDLSGKIVSVELYSMTDRSISEINPIIVMASDVWKTPLIDSQALFILLVTTVIGSLLLLAYSLVRTVITRVYDIGIALFPLVLSFAVWSMGTGRMLSIFIQDVRICSRAEYYALYVLAISIALFATSIYRNGIFHKIWIGILAAIILYYAVMIIIASASQKYTPQSFIRFLLIILLLEVLFFVIGLFADKNIVSTTSTIILRTGCIVMLLLAALEIGRYQLMYIPNAPAIVEFKIGSYSALVLAVIMVMFYIVLNLEEQTSFFEKQQLEAIAFKDTLTQIPNRTFFNSRLDELEADGQKDYTLVFIDLNDLKSANDKHGHEMGDRLIVATAECMTEAFAKVGIYCRWGGDEFVALIPGTRQLGIDSIANFERALDRVNMNGEFPFEIKAAHGEIYSSSKNYMSPNTAVREADIRMYNAKKRMKERDSV